MNIFENWTRQVRKGILELCTLNSLESGDRYGYDLVKSLTALPGLGIAEGTIYPLLSRLRVQGMVSTYLRESSEGPARKYYSLTVEGRKSLQMMNDYLDKMVQGSRFLRQGGKK